MTFDTLIIFLSVKLKFINDKIQSVMDIIWI
jgi:hypothetical protein